MTLDDFKHSLQSRIQTARQGVQDREQICREMVDLQPRLVGFEQLTTRLLSEVVRPRVGALAACFANANMDRKEQRDGCGIWFGFSNRFPASTTLQFTIEHDDRVENLVLRYELCIQPVFLKYEPHDKLVLSLYDCDESRIAAWVEQKIFCFLDDYLRLDRGEESLEEDLVTDPVCGMRLSRGAAAGEESYRGHAYFFCTAQCREQFVKEPSRYVWFRT